MKKIIITVTTAFLFGACNNSEREQAAAETARIATIDSINHVNEIRQQTIDSLKRLEQQKAIRYSSDEGSATSPEKKKGLNNAAKGALIGAGAGAVTGAIVDKKRGEGAIVGGLIGAGAGAITGAIIDKNKKKKEEEKKK